MYTPVSFDAKVEEYLGSAMTITVTSRAQRWFLLFYPPQ